jgi:broad specificity phosphatase PhoE
MNPRARSIVCLLLSLAAVGLLPAQPTEKGVGIFLVRHAEKDTDDARDPQLSREGRARAFPLARTLTVFDVSHLFATQFKRTSETLKPLSEATGVRIELVEAQKSERLLTMLRDLPTGSVAVVAGHSNTIPGLVCALGGQPDDLDCSADEIALDEDDYDRLYFVLLPAGGEGAPLESRSSRYGS